MIEHDEEKTTLLELLVRARKFDPKKGILIFDPEKDVFFKVHDIFETQFGICISFYDPWEDSEIEDLKTHEQARMKKSQSISGKSNENSNRRRR